jgi:hypothetical protein
VVLCHASERLCYLVLTVKHAGYSGISLMYDDKKGQSTHAMEKLFGQSSGLSVNNGREVSVNCCEF